MGCAHLWLCGDAPSFSQTPKINGLAEIDRPDYLNKIMQALTFNNG